MDDLNACAECGFTTTDLHQFTQHVMEHEQGSATTPLKHPAGDGESSEVGGAGEGVASPGSRSVQSGGEGHDGEMDPGIDDEEIEMDSHMVGSSYSIGQDGWISLEVGVCCVRE